MISRDGYFRIKAVNKKGCVFNEGDSSLSYDTRTRMTKKYGKESQRDRDKETEKKRQRQRDRETRRQKEIKIQTDK